MNQAFRPTHIAPDASVTRRRTLPRSIGYAVAAFVIFLGFAASVAPSPLYQSYVERWHFSSLTLTLIYATYAFGVLATLLLAGSVSDDVGRRPALLVAIGMLMLSTLVFVFAASPAWLFVARALGGLATGAAISGASAALLDLQPRRDPLAAAVTNAVMSSAGLGLAILVVSALLQAGSAPFVLPFVVLLGLLAVAFLGVFWMPEPVANRERLRLRVERPQVPSTVRGPFLLAGLGVLSSWSIAGLFFSLGPQLGAYLFDTTNAVVSSIGIFALLGTSALAQLTLGRTAPWLAASLGSVALAGGILLIVLATATESGTVYLVGSIVNGFGFGIAFLGGLRGLVGAIPPEHRAGVMSAFYVVAYTALSVPAILAGLLVDDLGLATTFEVFGGIAAALALVVAVGAWHTRPAASTTAGLA
jgi:predicted MFS family arabinose efflux permease